MTAQEFVYWLQGYLEVAEPKSIGEREVQIIKDHIGLVLHKVTPTPYTKLCGEITSISNPLSVPFCSTDGIVRVAPNAGTC